MRELRAELIAKTGWTKQTLSRNVQLLKDRLPMDTATAQSVLAFRNRIRLNKHLDAGAITEVQSVISRLGSDHGATHHAPVKPTARASHRVTPTGRSIVFPREFQTSDPLLSDTKLREARDMAAVYPILYVLENSLRELIRRVMNSKYGADWWNTALTGGKVKHLKDTCDQRRAKEDQMTWHQRRGAHPIDYVNLDDLSTIVEAKQDDFFPGILPDREYFRTHIRELAPSRNVLCHMNPLDETNVKSIRLSAEKWRKTIEASLSAIPSA